MRRAGRSASCGIRPTCDCGISVSPPRACCAAVSPSQLTLASSAARRSAIGETSASPPPFPISPSTPAAPSALTPSDQLVSIGSSHGAPSTMLPSAVRPGTARAAATGTELAPYAPSAKWLGLGHWMWLRYSPSSRSACSSDSASRLSTAGHFSPGHFSWLSWERAGPNGSRSLAASFVRRRMLERSRTDSEREACSFSAARSNAPHASLAPLPPPCCGRSSGMGSLAGGGGWRERRGAAGWGVCASSSDILILDQF